MHRTHSNGRRAALVEVSPGALCELAFPPGSVLTLYMNRCNCASSVDVLACERVVVVVRHVHVPVRARQQVRCELEAAQI